MRRERARERGGRRDKLIFEHFQTPLSPPSPAALHRVCLPGSGRNPSQILQLTPDTRLQLSGAAMGLTDSSRVRQSRRLSAARWRRPRDNACERAGRRRGIDRRHFRRGRGKILIASDSPFCLVAVLTAASAHFSVSSSLSHSIESSGIFNPLPLPYS